MSTVTGYAQHHYLPRMARVKAVQAMTDREVFLELSVPGPEPMDYTPGQFVQVSLLGIGEVPISICSPPTRGEAFQLCVRRAGIVTHAMQRIEAGSRLGIRGPFGHGFPLLEMLGHDLVLVAGGLGIAPLRSLIAYVLDNRESFGHLVVVYGTKSPKTLLFREDLASWREREDMELIVTVDEADESWEGRTGVATEPLADLPLEPERSLVVVVGPPVFYRFAAMALFERGLTPETIFFSLERNFHCGMGKCGHCQLNDLYVCQDGPVFRLSQLLKRTEAVEAWAPEADQDR